MAVHSKNSRVLVNEDHVSGHIKGWSVSHQRSYGSVTSILDDGERLIPGLLSGSMSLDGMFDNSVGSLYEELAANVAGDNAVLITVLPDGFTVGKPAIFAVTDIEGFEVPAGNADVVSMSVSATADEAVDLGSLLHGLVAETAGGNAASVDETASTAGGGGAILHVSALTGLTGLTVKVQHSSDNSVWVDLLTFTAATGTTSERKAVAGTVNRYVRALWTVTGTGSATFVVAFARR